VQLVFTKGIQGSKAKLGLLVERDRYFEPTTPEELKAEDYAYAFSQRVCTFRLESAQGNAHVMARKDQHGYVTGSARV